MKRFTAAVAGWAIVFGLSAAALPLLADGSSVSAGATTPTASATHHSKKVARAKPDPATKKMMMASDCFTCHAVDHKVIGPAYRDVAKRYRNTPGIVNKLVAKVKNGGSGNWGAVPMAGHPQLSDAQIRAMVKWVLAQ